MLEVDWSGKVHGSVSARGFSTPSPDGSRYLRSIDRSTVEDWRGHALGGLDADASSYGLGSWADDGQHFCGIVLPAGTGPDAGNASLWIGDPGKTGGLSQPWANQDRNPGSLHAPSGTTEHSSPAGCRPTGPLAQPDT